MTEPADSGRGLDTLFDLSGRTAIVTGGTRGIGLAIAGGLMECGANVVVASRKAEACAATVAVLDAAGTGRVLGVPTHVGRLDDVDGLVEKTVHTFGGVDIVVNNAAAAFGAPIGEITEEAWSKSFAVNLQGPVFLVQAALPHLRRSPHAAILNIVSGGAFMFTPVLSMYAAAKAAMVSFTRSMAAEFAPLRIRVNALAPGAVYTDMTRSSPPEMLAEIEASTLMKRIGQPSEMVAPALLLLSDAGSYITGQTIIVDGGLVAR